MSRDQERKIAHRFTEAVIAVRKARKALDLGDCDAYEHQLRQAVLAAGGTLEWTLKAHLRASNSASRMTAEEFKSLKQPTFEVLMDLMVPYGTPALEPHQRDQLFEFRRIRNQSEHDGAIPSARTVEEIIQVTRETILRLLPTIDQTLLPTNFSAANFVPATTEPAFLKESGSLVGRERELKQALSSLEAALANNSGQLILLRGLSGSGKTCLARHVCQHARQLGFEVAATACEPFHEGMTMFPVQELLRQTTGSGPFVETIGKFFPDSSMQYSLAQLADQPSVPPSQRRDAFLATFANGLFGRFRSRHGEGQPLLLFIDDMEWLDSGTADALICVRSRFAEGPVVILGSYRSDLIPRPAEHAIGPILNLAKRHNDQCRILDIDSLGYDVLGAVVESILGGPCQFSSRFLSRLYGETEGNPLFVREVLKMLAVPLRPGSDAVLQLVGGSWKDADETNQWKIPESIEEAIGTRLSQLESGQREELERASVIGRHFAYAVLRELSSLPEDRLASHLESLIDWDVIREIEEEVQSFAFTHGKIRDVIYQSLPKFRRLAMHASVADVLISLSRANSTLKWDAVLGNHLFQAARFEEAVPCLLSAARASREDFAVIQAADQYERCLLAAQKSKFPEKEDISAIIVEYVDALRQAGFYETAIRVLTDLLSGSITPRQRALALNILGDVHWLKGNMETSLKCYLDCQATAREHELRDLELEVSADLHEFYDREAERVAASCKGTASNHRLEAEKYLELEMTLVKSSADNDAVSRALRNKAKQYRRQGNLDESLRCYEEAIALGDPNVASHQVLISYAKTLRLSNREYEAHKVIARVLEWGIQTGSRRTEAIARQHLAMLSMSENIDLALTQAQVALELHKEIAYDRGVRECSLLCGELYLQVGETALALDHLERSTGLVSVQIEDQVLAATSQLQELGESQRAESLINWLSSWPGYGLG